MIVIASALLAATARADIWYVDIDAGPGGDGASWATAFGDLHDGLAAADSGDEVWVAEGIYRPAGPGGDRTRSFDVPASVMLYGGFRGNEVSLDQRDPTSYPTILSGDLNGDDEPQFKMTEDNSHNVLKATPGPTVDLPTRLDGLVVTGGRGGVSGSGVQMIGPGFGEVRGCDVSRNWSDTSSGGFMASGCSVEVTGSSFRGNIGGNTGAGDGGGAAIWRAPRAIVTECIFTGNRTVDRGGNPHSFGGGLHIESSDIVEVVDTAFEKNRGFSGGGGLSVWWSQSVAVTDCTFLDNSAGETGGGMGSWSCEEVTLTGCLFAGNDVTVRRNWIRGGAIYSLLTNTRVLDCQFIDNAVDRYPSYTPHGRGGAIYTLGDLEVLRCIFRDNFAGDSGGAIDASGSSLRIEESDFRGNDADYGTAVASNGSEAEVIVLGSVFAENGPTGQDVLLLRMQYGSSVAVADCSFVDNAAAGATVLIYAARMELSNLIITGNNACGIEIGSDPTREPYGLVRNCIIRNNQSKDRGGGLRLYGFTGDIVNCLIEGNAAESGGGIGADDRSDATITACTIVNNTATDVGGAAESAGESTLRFVNSIITDNGSNPVVDAASIDYCLIDGGSPGVNNIPGPAVFRDPLNDDWHLQPGAPGIDAGNADLLPPGTMFDLDGAPRLHDDTGIADTGAGDPPYLDLGVFEFQGTTGPFRLKFDPERPIAGQRLKIGAHGGEPDTTTWLAWSTTNTGQTFVPQLNVTLGLRDPVLAGPPARTRPDGRTGWAVLLPPDLAGVHVWFQAAQPGHASVVRGTLVLQP